MSFDHLFITDVEGERRVDAADLPLRVGTGTDCQLRFEHLDEDIEAIRDKLGVGPDFSVPRLNVTKSREDTTYRSFYDDRSREVVSQVFRRELETLGYGF